MTISSEQLNQTLDAYAACMENQTATARALGVSRQVVQYHLKIAAQRGLMGVSPVLPGFIIDSTSETTDADGNIKSQSVRQVREPGPKFEYLPNFLLKQRSTLSDGDGNTKLQWHIERPEAAAQHQAMLAVVEALKSDIPRAKPVILNPPKSYNTDLLNQFTVTDLHFGMLSWKEETGADYDLKIAEELLLNWFAAAIKQAPDAETAILCQLGDLLHHDAHASVTPAHGHVLDADSRLQKMIRVVIRTMRRVITMLLEKHNHVHVLMADANHDPSGGAWLREMFASFFEDEPRVTVDSSASTYYAYEHGLTSLFYHHGHKKKIDSVDSVFAGQFREVYGRTKFAYGHVGHLHSDELKSTNLMKIERHETLAAPDAYAANGGWRSGRSAKVITYSKKFGEVGRCTITPEMVMT